RSRRLPLSQPLYQFGGIDRLRQMMVEPCLQGALLILLLAPACEGDEDQALAPGLLTEMACCLVTVHLWHADVQKHQFRPKTLRALYSFETVVGDADLVVHHRQHQPQAVGGVPVVVHDKKTALLAAGTVIAPYRFLLCQRHAFLTDRKSNNE